MSNVKRAKQLSVFVENRPGVLARLCAELAAARINLLAISISDTVDHAVVRMVVDKPEGAIAVLEAHNAMIVQTEVLGVLLPNRPGVLAEVARKFARGKVNIEYAYGSTPAVSSGSAYVYFRVNDLDRAERALKGK